MNVRLNPKLIEVKKGENMVILTEAEYEQILDALDVLEAERVLADEDDPVLKWEDVHGSLIQNRIREARKARGITQKELARRLKITPTALRKMERENARHNLDAVKKISKALGCKVEDLI